MRKMYIIFILALASLCYANDGHVTGEGGSMRFMDGEHTTIRMVKEWVKMNVYTGYYTVYVKFIFTNDGTATDVKMGFPEKGGGDGVGDGYYSPTGYSHFRTLVDRKAVPIKRVALEEKAGGGYQAFWVKTVHFDKGQTRMIEVRYRSKPGDIAGGNNFVTYHFSGGNWKGVVKQSDLQVNLNLPGTIFFQPDLPNEKALAGKSLSGNRLSYSWKNWQAEGDFSLYYYNTDPKGIILSPAIVSMQPFARPFASKNHITRPGSGPFTVLSPVIIRRGNALISLAVLREHLTQEAARIKSSKVIITSWDEKKQTAILYVGKQSLRFTVGQKTILINNKDTIKIPTAPFLISGQRDKYLYVPLAPTMRALNGTATVDLKKREVTLAIHLADH